MADKIIILIDGRVAEMGKYDDLMRNKGALWQFINMNKIKSEEIGSIFKVLI